MAGLEKLIIIKKKLILLVAIKLKNIKKNMKSRKKLTKNIKKNIEKKFCQILQNYINIEMNLVMMK